MSFPDAAAASAAARRPAARTTWRGRRRRSARGAPRSVAEVPDWEAAARRAGRGSRTRALLDLDRQLERSRPRSSAAGGTVHWARDGAEANAIVAGLARAAGGDEAIKVKSMATEEIGLNDALAEAGIEALRDRPRRADRAARRRPPVPHPGPRDPPQPGRDPRPLRGQAGRARASRRARRAGRRRPPRTCARASCSVGVGICGANFAVAETGTVCVVESEGNGRMCTTLPHTLITVMGIEKVVPRLADLGTMLPLLARSATGERMNPYTSLWTGVQRRRRPAATSTSSCSTTAAPTCSPTASAARRCAASAARPASTSARSTSGPAATPTSRPTRARSGRSSRRS